MWLLQPGRRCVHIKGGPLYMAWQNSTNCLLNRYCNLRAVPEKFWPPPPDGSWFPPPDPHRKLTCWTPPETLDFLPAWISHLPNLSYEVHHPFWKVDRFHSLWKRKNSCHPEVCRNSCCETALTERICHHLSQKEDEGLFWDVSAANSCIRKAIFENTSSWSKLTVLIIILQLAPEGLGCR